ncbi:hypothetical protein CVN68_17530 [Sphingomonas psychrotolerans]|uniref:FAD-binding domain-containing protein n=2 Tax=Sphingomonas psychrotolerans TaxID=1327635 RepID=A0A2K8MLH5_9SPHN|nr:hypothetical protein CVN68_17530 [Sphingomonas psychrotolerans]
MDYDIAIVGGGPIGLAFARSLAGFGLKLAIIERQPLAALARPDYDGREIALSQRSVRILDDLGVRHLLPPGGVASLAAAHVLNGGAKRALVLDPARRRRELGKMVSNQDLRRALFEGVAGQDGLDWLVERDVEGIAFEPASAALSLNDGRTLRTPLVVAADGRLSQTRQAFGLGAEMNALGRSMLVVKVAHEHDHGQIATEWFDHGQTLALLPLQPRQSSFVLTLGDREIRELCALPPAALAAELERRSKRRWGSITLLSEPFRYPLVTTFAHRFVAPRAALIGDAAVGMHPVTAHGFNLGIQGQATLARQLAESARRGSDLGDLRPLRRYEQRHRLLCRPVFEATNHIVSLYTDERPHARALRGALLGLGARTRLPRTMIGTMLA